MEGDFLSKYIKLKDELQQPKKKDGNAQTDKILFEKVPTRIEKLADYLIEQIKCEYYSLKGKYPPKEISVGVLDGTLEIQKEKYNKSVQVMKFGKNWFFFVTVLVILYNMVVVFYGGKLNEFSIIFIPLFVFLLVTVKDWKDPFFQIEKRIDLLNNYKNQLHYLEKSEREHKKLISSSQEVFPGAVSGIGHHSAGEKTKVKEPLWNKTKRGAQIIRIFILAGLLDGKYKTIKWISNELKKFVKDNSTKSGIKTDTLDNYFDRRDSDFFVTIEKEAKNVHKRLKQEKDKRSGPNDINEHLRRASTLTIESIVNGLEPLFDFGDLNHEDPEILAILIYLYSDTTKTSVEFLHGLTLGQLIKTLSNCRIIIDKINELD